MKSSKAQIQAKFHKIPVMRFEDQKLTSFFGLLIFQLLFKRLDLKQRLKQCFAHLKVSPIFGCHLVVLLLVIHLLIGFRRLREVDYYRDDPFELRLMGLRRLPDVFTISRALSQMGYRGRSHLLKFCTSSLKIFLSGDAFTAFHGLTDRGFRQTQLPCKLYMLAGSSLLQNRFQALNEIITILVIIEDFEGPNSASNDMVQDTGSIDGCSAKHVI